MHLFNLSSLVIPGNQYIHSPFYSVVSFSNQGGNTWISEDSPDYEIVQPPINLPSIASDHMPPKEVTLQQNEAYSPI